MNQRPTAIVLGGTRPHIHLIQRLRARGYSPLLIDYYENPVAKVHADEHIQASTLDQAAVLEIAKARRTALVISACVDQANSTACYVAEQLGLPAPYSPRVAHQVTNKPVMKEIMTRHGIPTAKYYRTSVETDCLKHDLQFPLIVKPADCNGSKGVRRVENEQELLEYTKIAISISRSHEAIVEEYVDGIEVGIDCLISHGEAHIVCSRDRIKIPLNSDVQQIYGSIWPSDSVNRNKPKIKKIAEQIASAFELDNTPLMIQAIIANDEINVIEFAPRVGGGDNFRIINTLTEYDIVDATIDSFLGKAVRVAWNTPNKYLFDNYLYCLPGTFGKIEGVEHIAQAGDIAYWDIYKTPGMVIPNGFASNNRVGVFAVTAEVRNELIGKVLRAIDSIEVYDVDGRSILRKDIYKNLTAS